MLAVGRFSDPERPPRAYWLSFGLLLLLALLVPLLLNATGISGVAVPRWLGSIAILYASLTIFVVFASSFFAFGTKTGLPLLSLLREGNKWPIYVVSAQGGGVYAAYHASKAMALLSREAPDFPRHLFAISGVSGGSVGAALYANALDPAGNNSTIVERIDAMFEPDHLAPVLAAMLFPDTTQRFYPWPVPAWDRALGLELSFSDGGGAAEPVSLESSFYTAQRGPFLVLNTTEVASGRRFLLSPFRFDNDATFHEPLRPESETVPSQDVRFSTTAQRERRSVDGGYYDNSGAVTAEEILAAMNRELKARGLDGQAEVIPIAIANRSSFQQVNDSDRQVSTLEVSAQKPLLTISELEAAEKSAGDPPSFATIVNRVRERVNPSPL